MPVQRYFRTVLKEGQSMIASANIEMTGTMNMSATTERWKPFTSHQRVVTGKPSFLWDAKVHLFPGIAARVQDSYGEEQGHLNVKLWGLIQVANAKGGGELARGEFMRYLAEAAWYPTALLPRHGMQWQTVNESSSLATLTDGQNTITLLFRFDEKGLIASVRADARGAGTGEDMVMQAWECGLSNYQRQDGMLIPMTGQAAWERPEGSKVYFKGTITAISYEYSS